MRSHHQMEGEYFAKHDDMQLDNELNTNRCSPNLNCQMIVEMLFPPDRAREMLTIAIFGKCDREWERKRNKQKCNIRRNGIDI